MRRAGFVFVAAAPLCAGLTQAAGPNGSAPDMARQHYERQNCHQAYDLLVERLDQGAGVSEAEVAWARSYEDNAANGVPCPAPSQELAQRASNRTVVTDSGLAKLAAYHRRAGGRDVGTPDSKAAFLLVLFGRQ